MDELKLTSRARAWIEFHDEAIEGKFYCVAESMPSMFVRHRNLRIDQRANRVMLEWQQNYNFVARNVWMDGRAHPSKDDPHYVSYWGHSIGWYEGDELVVETRNFTFDPNGIDYQGQIPSSWLKRLTERYSRIGPDRLRLVFTVEDPLFLREPYTETLEFALSDHQFRGQDAACDLENASIPLEHTLPKYRDE